MDQVPLTVIAIQSRTFEVLKNKDFLLYGMQLKGGLPFLILKNWQQKSITHKKIKNKFQTFQSRPCITGQFWLLLTLH